MIGGIVDRLGSPWALVALIALALGALESERWWTRRQRGHDAAPGALAYALDGIALVGVFCAVASGGLLIARAAWSALSLVGAGLGRSSAGLAALVALGAVVALAAGVLVARRAGRPARLAPAGHAPAAPSPAVPPPAPRASQDQGAGEPTVEALSAISMHQSRPRPTAAPQPESFLTLRAADAGAAPAAKPRPARWPAPLALILLVALVGGAIWFRQPLGDLIAGASSGGEASLHAAAAPAPAAPTAAVSDRTAAVAPAAAPTSAAGSGEIRHVKSASLNMRAAPGTDQAVVAVLAQGDAVTLLPETRVVQDVTWRKVRVGAREGWVSEKLLEE